MFVCFTDIFKLFNLRIDKSLVADILLVQLKRNLFIFVIGQWVLSKAFSAKNFTKINGFSFFSLRKITVYKVVKRIVSCLMLAIIIEVPWQWFTHIKSPYDVAMVIFCWDGTIGLGLIWIVKGLNGMVFKFWLLNLIGSLFAEILVRARERVLNFLLDFLFVGVGRDSTEFLINALNGFKLDDIKITLAPFIDFISDKMPFDLRSSQCRHYFWGKLCDKLYPE